jgi:hypothetical protein
LQQGKSFFNANEIKKHGTCHTKQLHKPWYNARFFALHLNNRLDDGRVRSAKSFCEQRGDIEPGWSDEQIVEAIENLDPDKRLTYHKELLSKLGKELRPMVGRKDKGMVTNVVDHVVNGAELRYSFNHPDFPNLGSLYGHSIRELIKSK